jgi:predicted methyltransferase
MKLSPRFPTLKTGIIVLTLAGLLPLAASAQIRWESADRDKWQRPNDVMNAMGLTAGSTVADIGAGKGYFTRHFAQRVGSTGIVYAVDIDDDRLEELEENSKEEGLTQIHVVRSRTNDPMLEPGSVDAILIMNSYHEFREYDAMMQGMLQALRPGGVLAIIDSPMERAESRSVYHDEHDIPREVVKEDAARAGFTFLREEPGFKRTNRWRASFYFLLFEKPAD